jgi:hypothetical protein
MQRFGWSHSIAVIAAAVCVAALPAAATAQTITIAWDPSPDPRVIGYLAYVEAPSGDSRTFDVGMNVIFAFNEAVAGQQYCFAVSAYTEGPLVGPRSGQVCGSTGGNLPPVLDSPGDRISRVGQSVGLQLNGSDPEGEPVTYACTGLPPGLALQASTGFISGVPTTVGSYLVTVRVSDGLLSSIRTFTWTITASDVTPPSITISSPTTASSYSTASLTISMAGSASDNVGVSQVTWVNNRGGSGSATGRTAWSVASIALASGTNVITVTARDTAGNQASDTLTVNYTLPSSPLALTALTANRTAPQPTGTPITVTATVTGGIAPHQYKWWVYDGANWFVTRNWDTGNTWTWTPTVANSGYRVAVWVRNATTSTDTYENSNSNGSIAFPISSSGSSTSSSRLTLTSLSADRPAPQPAGTSITFAASATGGTGPYQYKWWIFDGKNWIVAQQWTTNYRWTWTPTAASAEARVGVWVRNAGSTADAYDNDAANGSISFAITSGDSSTSPRPPSTGEPLTLLGIYPSRSAPSPVGVAVQFSASTSGGIAPHQFKWWVYDGSTWRVMTGWSTNNTWTWTPPYANSQFRVAVWVRSAGSTEDRYDNAGSNGSIAFPVY